MPSSSNFPAIKRTILDRAKAAEACREQYRRAYESESLDELLGVVRDNFDWACLHKVITSELIAQYAAEFNSGDIFVNVDASRGCLLVDGSATVEAFDYATVRASTDCYCVVYGSGVIYSLHDRAIARIIDTGEIRYASDSSLRFVKLQ